MHYSAHACKADRQTSRQTDRQADSFGNDYPTGKFILVKDLSNFQSVHKSANVNPHTEACRYDDR
jgi:hypothetical protein